MMTGGDLLHDDSEETTGIAFRDMITLVLCGFVAIVIMLLPHLNPPGENKDEVDVAPGNVVVELRWLADSCADVDLWVRAPGDAPVGYSNKGGVVFNLLRDDLGCKPAADLIFPVNLETAYSRGFPPGEYTFNAHLYRDEKGEVPIDVWLDVKVKASMSDTTTTAEINTQATLTSSGQELTLLRFTLDENGKIVPGSVHSLQKNLRIFRNPSGD